MKMNVLYDLDDPVEITPQDAELFAVVNRGRANPLAGCVIAQNGPDLYLITKREVKRQKLFDRILSVLLILAILSAGFGFMFTVAVLAMPTEVPSIVSVALWLLLIPGLFLAGRTK